MHKVDELKVQAFVIAFDEDIIKTGSFVCVCVCLITFESASEK